MKTMESVRDITRDDILLTLELRLAGYDILRHIFMEEPTKEFVDNIYSLKLMELFPYTDACSNIHKGTQQVQAFSHNQPILSNEAYESLHWDYTQLFIGPEKPTAPPWASTYVNKEGILFQEETLNVRRAYIKHEMLPTQYRKEADDYIGLELDFIYQLIKKSIQSLDEWDQRRTYEYLIDQGIFLENHVLSWIDPFCKNIEKNANTDFYQGFSAILQGFLKQDKKIMDELIQLFRE